MLIALRGACYAHNYLEGYMGAVTLRGTRSTATLRGARACGLAGLDTSRGLSYRLVGLNGRHDWAYNNIRASRALGSSVA